LEEAAFVHVVGEPTERQANDGDTLTFVNLVYFQKHCSSQLAQTPCRPVAQNESVGINRK
jgi:hypothetical protein